MLLIILKVVPPKKWKATNINYEDIMEDLKILGPIEQNTYGKGGIDSYTFNKIDIY